jgi:thiamine pyrophosphate-dependent acetolactate synthase large subunit-like protein
MITPGYQGTLGFAFATALGAKVGCPDKSMIALCGDGGFLFTATELATCVSPRVSAPPRAAARDRKLSWKPCAGRLTNRAR